MFFTRVFLLLALLVLTHAGVVDKTGYGGEINGGQQSGLAGVITVKNTNTLLIKDYVLADASAPALHWWGTNTNQLSDGFRIANKQVTDISDGGDLVVVLDAGKTPSDFTTVGLWCERFHVDFGHAKLVQGGAALGAGDSQFAASSRKPVIKDHYIAGRVYFLCVLCLLFFESMIHLPIFLVTCFAKGRLPTVSPRQHSRFYLFFHHIVTRPSPFPALTGMPVVDLLRLSALFGLNLLWGWNRNLFNTDFELYGYLTLANGGLALLMGARSNLFAMLARIPSSTLLFYHHWTGRATVIHATIHSALLILSYVQSQQLNVVLQTARIQVGFAAWIALLVILVTSLNLIRRKFFEVFFYPHILFLAFVIGALIHATQAAEFLLPGLALWVIDRLIRLTYNFRAVKITTVSQHAGHLTKFTVTGLRRHAPSQIAWIQIPTISFLNWHPFTIVSVPSSKGEATFAVRGLGGYTKKLHEAVTSDSDATSCPKLQASSSLVMRVDGPYGVGHIPWGYYSVNIIVAGGIGITPGMTIANHIVELAQKAHHVGPDRGWHVHILWVIKTAQFITWFDEELASLAALAADKDVAVTFDLDVHVTGNTALDESSYEDHTPPKLPAHLDPRSCIRDGRPDMPSYFHGLRKLYPGLDAGVSACGPRSLINSVRLSAVTPLSGSKNMGAYHVEEEVFEL